MKLLLIEDEANRKRCIQGAIVTSRLVHPHILGVLDHGEEEAVAWIVYELVEGRSLEAILERGPLDAWTALETLAAICRGLASAHQAGAVHRDLKPANVLCGVDGSVKLADFGAAKWCRGEVRTAAGVILGGMTYAPRRRRRLIPEYPVI